MRCSIVSTTPRESLFSTLHLDNNSLKSDLLHLAGQPNSQKGRAKVKDGIILGSLFFWTISVLIDAARRKTAPKIWPNKLLKFCKKFINQNLIFLNFCQKCLNLNIL